MSNDPRTGAVEARLAKEEEVYGTLIEEVGITAN